MPKAVEVAREASEEGRAGEFATVPGNPPACHNSTATLSLSPNRPRPPASHSSLSKFSVACLPPPLFLSAPGTPHLHWSSALNAFRRDNRGVLSGR